VRQTCPETTFCISDYFFLHFAFVVCSVSGDIEALPSRTHLCGQLLLTQLHSSSVVKSAEMTTSPQRVVVCGWVQHSRSIGEQLFQVSHIFLI
jgi:hypothetical protein